MIMNRLRLLYHDLHTLLSPLLPSSHIILLTLISPLSPTSSPLRSSRNFLVEVLDELGRICAPVRDEQVQSISRTLLEAEDAKLSSTIVDALRSIFTLAETMAADLHHFAFSHMTEVEIASLIAKEAQKREHGLVLRLYGGIAGVRRTWTQWRARSTTSSSSWRSQLVATLTSPTAISPMKPPMTELPPENGAPPPTDFDESSSNINPIPAPFLIPSPTFFLIQNLLQCLVIASCLRILAYPSHLAAPPSFSTGIHKEESEDPAETFTSRIWILLEAEIQRSATADPQIALVNLEDEVWQITKQHASAAATRVASSGPDEAIIRGNVQRLLRADDPVFKLLMGRLENALVASLHTSTMNGGAAVDSATPLQVPVSMKTGRSANPSVTHIPTRDMQPASGGVIRPRSLASPLPPVKGFESQSLRKRLGDVAAQLHQAVEWSQTVWSDIMTAEP
ncbi:hypothetical protein DL93DRAFT_1739102 [Clavulina sp. PMI_390]|nr:hypothetical protein DL93DRAFT_1739102 [Clavulina sp. PMI_390]